MPAIGHVEGHVSRRDDEHLVVACVHVQRWSNARLSGGKSETTDASGLSTTEVKLDGAAKRRAGWNDSAISAARLRFG
jgi:hypothetical protein